MGGYRVSRGRPLWFASAWPAPAVEAFRLREVSWNCASSPGTNPPGVEVLVVVEEDGVRGGGVVRGDSEGLFKGLAVGRPFSGAVGNHRTASPVNRWTAGCLLTCMGPLRQLFSTCLNAPSGAGCFLTFHSQSFCAVRDYVLMHLLVLGAFWPWTGGALSGSSYRLNAPSGAGGFLTVQGPPGQPASGDVLMHLLVLGAF